MKRLTDQDRKRYATDPGAIPRDTQCDHCDRGAVARGTDGRRAFALCAEGYLEQTEARRAGPRVDAATRATAIARAGQG